MGVTLRRGSLTALVLAAAMLAGSPFQRATAQPPDAVTIERQFHERYNAADYSGALSRRARTRRGRQVGIRG